MSIEIQAAAKEPKRERGKQRVAALLDAGAELFAEKGYEATTMTEIASRAGAAIDHVSFRVTGYAALRSLLKERNIHSETRIVPRNGDVQVFIDDPNGVTVELTFLGSEVSAEEKSQLVSR